MDEAKDDQPQLTYGVIPPEVLMTHDGVDVLRGMADGRFPIPPISELFDYGLESVEEGRIVFTAVPGYAHYNPMGSVHGGYFATLLDTCMGCAVFSMLKAGTGYTTLEFKVNIVRAMFSDTGRIYAEGKAIHTGRQVATAEAFLRDGQGRLYAHATTTCLVFPLSRKP